MDFFSILGHGCIHVALLPSNFLLTLRLADEGIGWRFLKDVSKEGFVNTRRSLINARVPLDARDHAFQQQEATPSRAREPRLAEPRLCSPFSLGLSERTPHVTTLSWHLSPRGAHFLRTPRRRERERPCLCCPKELLHHEGACSPRG